MCAVSHLDFTSVITFLFPPNTRLVSTKQSPLHAHDSPPRTQRKQKHKREIPLFLNLPPGLILSEQLLS